MHKSGTMNDIRLQIAKTCDIIRKKHRKLKKLTSGMETQFNNTYKPIIELLEKIAAQREGEKEEEKGERGVQKLEMPEGIEQLIMRPVERPVARSRKRKVADASAIENSSIFQTVKHG